MTKLKNSMWNIRTEHGCRRAFRLGCRRRGCWCHSMIPYSINLGSLMVVSCLRGSFCRLSWRDYGWCPEVVRRFIIWLIIFWLMSFCFPFIRIIFSICIQVRSLIGLGFLVPWRVGKCSDWVGWRMLTIFYLFLLVTLILCIVRP